MRPSDGGTGLLARLDVESQVRPEVAFIEWTSDRLGIQAFRLSERTRTRVMFDLTVALPEGEAIHVEIEVAGWVRVTSPEFRPWRSRPRPQRGVCHAVDGTSRDYWTCVAKPWQRPESDRRQLSSVR